MSGVRSEGLPRSRKSLLTRRSLLAAGTATLASFGSGCRSRNTVSGGGTRDLTVWHSWGGVMDPLFRKVLAAFERAHPNVRLRTVFTQHNVGANQKFFTAVAARTPPDVVFVDGPQVASWAEWGSIEPLTERVRAAGIRDRDYFPPTWAQNVYRDDVWALTFCADPNFGFAWNKSNFRQAGLDPERPPRTIEELNEVSDRLTSVDESGSLRQIGIVPWAQYGAANSIFTWGWAFGGTFYDPETRKITAAHPRVVQALEWMIRLAKQHNPAKITTLQTYGAPEGNPFYTGKLSMQCLHIGGVRDVRRYAPNLDYGISYLPAPSDGEAHSSWVGGWCMSIPKGAPNPDDAWEFIRWLCHDPEGTLTMGRETNLLPGLRHSPYFEEARDQPYFGDFVGILERSRHQRPVMPVQAFYMRELQRAVDAAVHGKLSPGEALARAQRNTQAELDLVLTGS